MIHTKYQWLFQAKDLPRMVQEAIKIGKLNTSEIPGPKSNPEIMALAAEAGVADIYKSDETAWCAVAICAIAVRAGKVLPFTGFNRLRAVSFRKFGSPVVVAMLGDVLVFERPGGYHVGLYIGEDESCYHVAGGNQSNQFNITRIEKNRLLEARRPQYNVTPITVKRIILTGGGVVSNNES